MSCLGKHNKQALLLILSLIHTFNRKDKRCLFPTAVTYALCTALWHPGNLLLHSSETSVQKLMVIIPGGLQVLKGNTITHLISADTYWVAWGSSIAPPQSQAQRVTRCSPSRAVLLYAKWQADLLPVGWLPTVLFHFTFILTWIAGRCCGGQAQ